MNKKIITITLLLIILFSTSIFAATASSEKAVLSIVENNVCTIDITNKSIFEKKIVDYDLEKKELTIGLKVSNNAEVPLDKPTEIVLLIDNSGSMQENTIDSTSKTRMTAVTESANKLATSLLEYDTVKISVVSFSFDPTFTAGNTFIGSEKDATLKTALTNVKDTVSSAISSIATDDTGYYTDIDAGLDLANKQFSGTCENEYIILLSDGCPNVYLGSTSLQYYGETTVKTKETLKKISDSGINIITMMTGVTDNIESLQTNKTYKALAEEVFGTSENPYVGTYYYITDDQIEKTVSETILNELVAPEQDILTDIDIYDYFPQEIVDNFTFEFVKQPTIGKVSEDIDLQNNMITWHIDKLSYGESCELSYKLTLKDNIDTSIIDEVLNTNTKIDITTKNVLDENGNKKIITSDVTPKVKVTLKQDTTVAEDKIPQTGTTITSYIAITVLLIICLLAGFNLFKNREIK